MSSAAEPLATREANRLDRPRERPQKSYHTILEQQLAEATEELERPAAGLLLSGLTAGLDIGFGPFAMVTLATVTRDAFSKPVRELLAANLYAVGFIFVVVSHSALFTEHTTTAVQPVLARRAGVGQLLRLWGLVLAANLAGAAAFAAGAAFLGPALGVADRAAMGELAAKVVHAPPGVMLSSAVAAGWLMGLMAWLTTAVRSSGAQLAVIWLCAFVIGFAGFHHSIAGTVEVLMGVFAGQGATGADLARFLPVTVAGNALGGAVFVGLLKFAHVRQGAP
jgi:formate/nitrite transporter FocA (FNT family)